MANDLVAVRPTHRISRPTEYTEELAREFCAFIGEGESIRTACLRPDMPSQATIFRWRGDPELAEFHHLLEAALRLRAMAVVDDIIDISDELIRPLPPGVVRSMIEVAAAQTRINTRKWVAERLLREMYGKEVTVKNEQIVTHRHELVEKVMKMVAVQKKQETQALSPDTVTAPGVQ